MQWKHSPRTGDLLQLPAQWTICEILRGFPDLHSSICTCQSLRCNVSDSVCKLASYVATRWCLNVFDGIDTGTHSPTSGSPSETCRETLQGAKSSNQTRERPRSVGGHGSSCLRLFPANIESQPFWRFPKIGPQIIHLHWIFHEIHHPAIGDPIWKSPVGCCPGGSSMTVSLVFRQQFATRKITIGLREINERNRHFHSKVLNSRYYLNMTTVMYSLCWRPKGLDLTRT